MPPARGPGAPAKLIVITVRGVSSAAMRQSNGPNSKSTSAARCAASDQTIIVRNGSGSGSWSRATRTSVTSVIDALSLLSR
jgi:hypothetical protein